MTISTTVTAGGRTFVLTGATTKDLADTAADLTANLDRLLEHLPPAEPPDCQHGPRVHVTGESTKGPWAMWACPLPADRKDERCAPVWIEQ